MIFFFDQLFSTLEKKIGVGWSITCLVSTQKEFLICLVRNLLQSVSMGKRTDISHVLKKKKKSTGVILNICTTLMERC